MTKAEKILKSTAVPAILTVVTVLSAILYRSTRATWSFVNFTLGIEGFNIILLSLICILAAVLGSLTALRVYGCKKGDEPFYETKAYKALLIIGAVFAIVFIIFALIYAIGSLLSEDRQVYMLNLKKTLSDGILLIVVPFLSVFFPALGKKAKTVTLIILLTATALYGINSIFPLTPYKITSEPLVIDNGNEYSVVFSTNGNGTAYVEYNYAGKDYKVFDNNGGRLSAESKIHSIAVPYEHLRNNTYKIGSTRVIEQFSYGSRTGKNILSDEYKFVYNDSETQIWLVISDWHTRLNKAYGAIEHLDSDYDGVIMLGDASPGFDFEEQLITSTVEFGGQVSGGTKPVIYVRGNHETRGAYAEDLPAALGLEQLYYTTDIGPYSFVVLDSGEDKDDSHEEYGGMNDYNTYRADMIEWLKDTQVANEKVITLSHSWRISDVEEDLSAAGWAEINRLNTRLIISGHHHECRFLGEGSEKEKEVFAEYPDVIGYLDGGTIGDSYVASLLTIKNDGFTIKAVDNSGNQILEEEYEW